MCIFYTCTIVFKDSVDIGYLANTILIILFISFIYYLYYILIIFILFRYIYIIYILINYIIYIRRFCRENVPSVDRAQLTDARRRSRSRGQSE